MNEGQESKIIKIILPGMCPHCNKEVLMAIKTITPVVDWVLRKEDIQKAKGSVIKEVSESDIPAIEKKQVLEWVQKEDTLFGPEEVQHILSQVIKKDDKMENKGEEKPADNK